MIALSPPVEDAGYQLLHVTRAPSTNEAALKAVAAGADRLWVIADEQLSGRGRQGRAWHSPPGNLYASLGLIDPCAAEHAPLLGFVAGLALAEAIRLFARNKVHLKWPNDCLLDGGKLAGILLEGTTRKDKTLGIAIGIGVNIAHRPEHIGQKTAQLSQLAPILTPGDLFSALSARMAANLDLFDRGKGFAAIREGWLKHALPLGSPLRVRLEGGEKHGTFAGIAANGQLLLSVAGVVETLMIGDVFLGTPA
jgi:BirA family transcriptional regulator, biotin operon repressor / biotin---[acetyl-CoA-carboxylase] ligase